MENNELRSLLTKLHEEIKNTKEVDDTGVDLLRDLEADIAALLEQVAKLSAILSGAVI